MARAASIARNSGAVIRFTAVAGILACTLVMPVSPVVAVTREVFLMGTRAMLTTWAQDRAHGLQDLELLLEPLEQTERQLSTWVAESEISAINHANGRLSLSPSLCVLLAEVERWTRETGRTFDPSIGALTSAWGIHEGGRLPSDREIDDARSHSGWNRVSLEPATCALELAPGVRLDVGAFGKGAALDRAREAVPDTVVWLLDLGGQVAVNGAPPRTRGWPVSIADPQRRTTPALEVRLSSGSISTSAGSERDAHVNTTRVGHIIDPRTGHPAPFDGSVTVWHERALAADILSTALYVMGVDDGLRWADQHDVAGCYLLRDGRIRASRAFRRRFPVPARFESASTTVGSRGRMRRATHRGSAAPLDNAPPGL
jgi:thiamine biosynthesis lipoprotein